MKNRFTLLETGSVLFIFGMSMIIFPSIFEEAKVHQGNERESFITGIYLITVGTILLLVKLYQWKYPSKDSK